MTVPLAHLLAPTAIPAAAVWAAVVVLCAAGACLVLHRSRWLERAAWAVFVPAFATCVTSVVLAIAAPVAPDRSIALMVPTTSQTATSPLQVLVCATTSAGAAVAATSIDLVLDVLIDGREVTTESADRFAVPVDDGVHLLRVELVTGDHHVLSPEVAAETTVVVAGQGPTTAAVTCPGRA
jgi:hypothetical protein